MRARCTPIGSSSSTSRSARSCARAPEGRLERRRIQDVDVEILPQAFRVPGARPSRAVDVENGLIRAMSLVTSHTESAVRALATTPAARFVRELSVDVPDDPIPLFVESPLPRTLRKLTMAPEDEGRSRAPLSAIERARGTLSRAADRRIRGDGSAIAEDAEDGALDEGHRRRARRCTSAEPRDAASRVGEVVTLAAPRASVGAEARTRRPRAGSTRIRGTKRTRRW